MNTLQERVNLLSKEFEKLKNFQQNMTEHSNEQQEYENCWNQSSSNKNSNNNDKVMTSFDDSNDRTDTMVGQSKENTFTKNADDLCQQLSTNTKKKNGNNASTTATTTCCTVPLFMNSSSTLMWQDIEINNLTTLLSCTKPKKFFRLAVDYHDVRASLKNGGCLSINSHLFQSMSHYSKDIIDRYVLIQETLLNNVTYSECLIGVALVITVQKTPSSMTELWGGGDKEIYISYLSLSRTSTNLSEITMNEVGKIKEMLSTHIENLKKKAVLPYIGDIYVSSTYL